MIAAIQSELDAIAGDPSVRVVVLAAEGRGFCAGHDLKEMRAHAGDKAWQRQLFDDCSRMMMTLTALPQPVIARVHGIATAAGCQLVSMCDLAVAADTATFAMPGINIGVFCSTPAVGVARNVGRKRAMEMLLTGEPIDAPTALAWGLVNRVVPAAELDAAVGKFIDGIVSRSRCGDSPGQGSVLSARSIAPSSRPMTWPASRWPARCCWRTPLKAWTHFCRSARRAGGGVDETCGLYPEFTCADNGPAKGGAGLQPGQHGPGQA